MRAKSAYIRHIRDKTGVDNAPDLPPFTSLFYHVIIVTIQKLCRLRRGVSVWGYAAPFPYTEAGAHGVDEILQ